MNIWDLRAFRMDLSKLIELIGTYNVTGNFQSLSTLLDDLDSKGLVEYDLKELSFEINGRIEGTQPDHLNYYQIFLENMLMVKDVLDSDLDPLYAYNFDILISVYKSRQVTKKEYSSSWHLDKHKDINNTKYTHPTYHFQFGGKKLELIDDDMAVLSCPRIPHPPMDIFLGFHFIINNFFNSKNFQFVNQLKEDYEYQRIIKRAQERLWTPYFKAFDSGNTNTDFTFKNLFPLYIH